MTAADELVDAICAAAVARPGDVRVVVGDLVDAMAPLADDDERSRLIRRAVARLDGLDVLDTLLGDPAVDEVMVNRGGEVWVDRSGHLTPVAGLRPGLVDAVLERVLAPLGRRVDRTQPFVDARLPDGARLCAVVAPVAVDGTAISIRQHRSRKVTLDEFADPPIVHLLRSLIDARANILVTGATSTGKTTLLGALIRTLDHRERLVVVEDTTELVLDGHHAVRLETRTSTADGLAAVDAAQLVRTSLRLRPDRLIIGEFRGPEALAIIEALNTGHDGSISTCHANDALDAIRRLETLVMQAVPAWPLPAIRRQVTRSIDAIIHLRRRIDGSRHVAEVVEVVEGEGEPAGTTLAVDGRVVGQLQRGRR